MTTKPLLTPSLYTFLSGLIDYAGLYPQPSFPFMTPSPTMCNTVALMMPGCWPILSLEPTGWRNYRLF